MSYEEIYNGLKAKMTDDKSANEAMLREEVKRFIAENNQLGLNAASTLIMENMPAEKRDEIIRITHIDGVRLDKVYENVEALIKKRDFNEAKKVAEKLYKKITVEFKETDKERFASLRNPFEDALFHELFKPEKTITRTPFDFAQYITTYAYILVETGDPLDAIPILRVAEQFNPVDVSPKFELAEVYKLLHNKAKMLELTKETLKIASSPFAIARCYANVGYILIEHGDYDDAVAFLTASAMMAPNPAIPREMQHVADLKGSPVQYIGKDNVAEILKKYDINFGPDTNLIRVSAELASSLLTKGDHYNALQAMKITYNLTLDENIKKMILKYDPTAEMKFKGEPMPTE